MKWISVEEGLPDFGEVVMVYHTGVNSRLYEGEPEVLEAAQRNSVAYPHKFATRYKTWRGSAWMVQHSYSGNGYITEEIKHWAPLLPPPEE